MSGNVEGAGRPPKFGEVGRGLGEKTIFKKGQMPKGNKVSFETTKGRNKTKNVAKESFHGRTPTAASAPKSESKIVQEQLFRLIEDCAVSNLQKKDDGELQNLSNNVHNFANEYPELADLLRVARGNIRNVKRARKLQEQCTPPNLKKLNDDDLQKLSDNVYKFAREHPEFADSLEEARRNIGNVKRERRQASAKASAPKRAETTKLKRDNTRAPLESISRFAEGHGKFVDAMNANFYDSKGDFIASSENLHDAREAARLCKHNEKDLDALSTELTRRKNELEAQETDLMIQDRGGKGFVPKKGAEKELQILHAKMEEIESARVKLDKVLEDSKGTRSNVEGELIKIHEKRREATREVNEKAIRGNTQNAIDVLNQNKGLIAKLKPSTKKQITLIKKRLGKALKEKDPKEIEKVRLGLNVMIARNVHPDKIAGNLENRKDANDKVISEQFTELFKALYYEKT